LRQALQKLRLYHLMSAISVGITHIHKIQLTSKQQTADTSRESKKPDKDPRMTEVLFKQERNIAEINIVWKFLIIPRLLAHQRLLHCIRHIFKCYRIERRGEDGNYGSKRHQREEEFVEASNAIHKVLQHVHTAFSLADEASAFCFQPCATWFTKQFEVSLAGRFMPISPASTWKPELGHDA